VLKQRQYQPMPAEKEVMILFAGANGYLDEWPASAISKYEEQMLEFVGKKYGDIYKELKEKNDISESLAAKMKKALDEFKSVFQPAA